MHDRPRDRGDEPIERKRPLREADGGVTFNGDGQVVDYAVKMIRLPAERMADRLLEHGELTAGDMEKIAVTVA